MWSLASQPQSLDSESRVLAATPRDQLSRDEFRASTSNDGDAKKSPKSTLQNIHSTASAPPADSSGCLTRPPLQKATRVAQEAQRPRSSTTCSYYSGLSKVPCGFELRPLDLGGQKKDLRHSPKIRAMPKYVYGAEGMCLDVRLVPC